MTDQPNDRLVPWQVALARFTHQIRETLRERTAHLVTVEDRIEVVPSRAFNAVAEDVLDTMPGARGAQGAKEANDRYWKDQQDRIDAHNAALRREMGWTPK